MGHGPLGLNHGGELPQRVKFVKRWTRIPKPETLIKKGLETGVWGYEPWAIKSRQKEQEVIQCDKTPHAQLDNEMRARHGLPLLDDDGFKPIRNHTWWSRKLAEEKKAEREATKDAERVKRSGPAPSESGRYSRP